MVNVGDLCWDIMSQTMWIVTDIWWCSDEGDYKYDLVFVSEPQEKITTNDVVATHMRADFLKRTNYVLDKSEE